MATNSIQKSAKTAGLAYLIIIISSILVLIVGPLKLMVEGDTAATVRNIESNQFLFKFGAAYDLLMFIGVIILSVALYRILEIVNKAVALTALLSRVGEAFIGSLTVVCTVIILVLINDHHSSESNIKMIGLIFDLKNSLMNLVFAFLGFGSILFCYLFYRKRMIPRILAAFGMFAFVLVFVESIVVLLFPWESTVVTGLPAILFELIIGFWLLIKGVNLKYLDLKQSRNYENA